MGARPARAAALCPARGRVTLERGSPAGNDLGRASRWIAARCSTPRAWRPTSRAGAAPAARCGSGGSRALRFDGLEGDGPSVLYVASTSTGRAGGGVRGQRAWARPCAAAAGGLELRGARAYDPPRGSPGRTALAREMRRLRARRARGLRALRAAARRRRHRPRAANRDRQGPRRGRAPVRGRDAPPQAAARPAPGARAPARRRSRLPLAGARRARTTTQAAFERAQAPGSPRRPAACGSRCESL